MAQQQAVNLKILGSSPSRPAVQFSGIIQNEPQNFGL
jgi:hypothetical protein